MSIARSEGQWFDGEKSLEYYYQEVDRYPQITAREEQDLAARIERGDEKALEKLVQANLRFVIHIAKSFQNQGLSMADLINEGNLGLLTAARKFNRRKGCKFITYAVWWIRQNILKALEVQTRNIRVPANVFNDLNRLRRAEVGLAQDLNRDPTLEEVAAEVNFQAEKVAHILDAASNTISMHTPSGGEADVGLEESVPDLQTSLPDESLFRKSRSQAVSDALRTLSDRHQQVLSLVFGMDGAEPATYQQIGSRLGISRERVRQLKEDALNKLKQPTLRKRLAAYAE